MNRLDRLVIGCTATVALIVGGALAVLAPMMEHALSVPERAPVKWQCEYSPGKPVLDALEWEERHESCDLTTCLEIGVTLRNAALRHRDLLLEC